MDFLEQLMERNAHFAATEFSPELKIMPSTGTIIVGCVDPRVDPAEVLGLQMGEAAVIRNVGGRVDKRLIETLAILRVVAKARRPRRAALETWSCCITPIAGSSAAIIMRRSCSRKALMSMWRNWTDLR